MNTCKVCIPDNYKKTYHGSAPFDKEFELDGSSWTGLLMLYDTETHKFGICASGADEIVTEINYCPFCGRKL